MPPTIKRTPAKKVATKTKTPVAARRQPSRKGAEAYHHGALREALLGAAETVLERDGIQGLTLRAAAREAGVSHAAPKHHFGDIAGLLTELAAVGFERLRDIMVAGIVEDMPPATRLDASGRGYVAFAQRHPGLFLLMFRSERLDASRANFRAAANAALGALAGALAPEREASPKHETLTLVEGARIARAWSLVHGFAMLLIDGRLKPLVGRLPEGADADALLEAILSGAGAPHPGGKTTAK